MGDRLSLPRGQYANDDLLGAFAALWSAERVVAGKAAAKSESSKAATLCHPSIRAGVR
jgi:hypothetical protein